MERKIHFLCIEYSPALIIKTKRDGKYYIQ